MPSPEGIQELSDADLELLLSSVDCKETYSYNMAFGAYYTNKSYYHRFYHNKFCKTILTRLHFHDTLYSKSC